MGAPLDKKRREESEEESGGRSPTAMQSTERSYQHTVKISNGDTQPTITNNQGFYNRTSQNRFKLTGKAPYFVFFESLQGNLRNTIIPKPNHQKTAVDLTIVSPCLAAISS